MKELIAARELDTLVAEKVMGLDRPMGGYIHDGFLSLIPLPFYSSDIAAAWQVVERCDSFNMYRSVGGWVAELSLPKGRVAEAFAETAPLAICKAALASVEK